MKKYILNIVFHFLELVDAILNILGSFISLNRLSDMSSYFLIKYMDLDLLLTDKTEEVMTKIAGDLRNEAKKK